MTWTARRMLPETGARRAMRGVGLHPASEGGLVGVAEDSEGESGLFHGVEEALGFADPLGERAGLAGRPTHEGHEDGA